MMVLFKSTPEAGDEEFVIFADTPERATELFANFWFRRDALPITFGGDEYEKWSLFGTKAELQAAQRLGREGMGTWDEVSGWTILPAIWE